VAEQDSGVASSLLNTAHQVGGAMVERQVDELTAETVARPTLWKPCGQTREPASDIHRCDGRPQGRQ